MANDWNTPPTEAEAKAAGWDAPPTEAEMAAVMDLVNAPPRPVNPAQAVVDEMGPIEGAVTAFGENARHAIRQAANLLPFDDSPTDEQLREEASNLAPLRKRFPVASVLGGGAISVPPAVVAAGALAPAGASLGATMATGAGIGAATGATFSDPGQRATTGAIGGLAGGLLPGAVAGAGRLMSKAPSIPVPGPLKRWAERAAVRSTGADRTAFKKAFGRPYDADKVEASGRFLLDEGIPLRTPAAMKEGLEEVLRQEGPQVGALTKRATQAGADVDLWGATLKAVQDPKVASLAKNTEEAAMYRRVVDFLRDQLTDKGAKITPEAAHDLRRTLDRLASWDQATPKQLTRAWRTVRGVIDDELGEAMKRAGLGEEWAKTNARFAAGSKAKGLADIGAERRAGNQLGSLTEKMAAGTAIPAALASGNPYVAATVPAYAAVNRFGNPVLARVLNALSRQAAPQSRGAAQAAAGTADEVSELLRMLRLSPAAAESDATQDRNQP